MFNVDSPYGHSLPIVLPSSEELRQRLEALIQKHQMTPEEAVAKAREQEPSWGQEDLECLAGNIRHHDFIEAIVKAVPELIVENNRVLLDILKPPL